VDDKKLEELVRRIREEGVTEIDFIILEQTLYLY